MNTLKSNIDNSVDPKSDFYGYACGGWQKSHPLEGEYAIFGTFNLLGEEARRQVRDLIENLAADPDASVRDSIAQKVNDIYRQGLDMKERDRLGITPLLPMLERVEKMRKEDLTEILIWMMQGLESPFFTLGVGPDPADSDMNILHIGEAGLGLGDRDYYLVKNDTNGRILEAYHKYINRIMTLSGYDQESAERIWNSVIGIETEMARHKLTREERRDPMKRYNMRTLAEIRELYPLTDWDKLFEGVGLRNVKGANLSSPDYLGFIDSYIPRLTERELKDFLIAGIVMESTGVLGEDFYNADFELYDRVMSGTEEKKPLWKRAMTIPNSMFGEAIGQLYVEKYFPEKNKMYMLRLVENLRKALGSHIRSLQWMGAETKEKALDKLASLRVKIGYPDKWKDYSEIHIDPSRSYAENVLEASRWFTRDNFSKLDKPVDKEEWFMTPQTVNAYYAPSINEICFPAGILQPPYFDINADDALNYGAIGVVIGHEMIHGFDDQGRRYDKNGNLSNWWSDEDETKFKRLTEKLVKQFDAVEVAPGVHANGTFTLGENIADQGGLRVALTAYRDNCTESAGREIDGFSPCQRFYLSYAGVWASNIRPEEILSRTMSDPHSLARNRVNVTLRNIEPFFDAFGIGEGDAMYLPADERVIIW